MCLSGQKSSTLLQAQLFSPQVSEGFVAPLPFSEQACKVDMIVRHFIHEEARGDERFAAGHN